MVRFLGGLVGAIRRVATVFVIAAFGYMTVAVLVQVGGRYFFNYSIAGTEETAIWAQVFVVLVGSGLAMHKGMHVAVDVLARMLPPWPARVLSLCIGVGAVWFLGVVIWGSIPLIEVGMVQTSGGVQAPMWLVYLILPVGCAYLALETALSVIGRWDDPFAARASSAAIGGPS